MMLSDQKGSIFMHLHLARCDVRTFREDDAESLAFHANNRKIWINLRDLFPHPYTITDAEEFLKKSIALDPETRFAVAVDGKAVGAIGFGLRTDVERISAEIGYWLGEPFWNRGIMTEVLRAVTEYAIAEHGLMRIYALPYAWSHASCRVLEKSGYLLEGRLRRSAVKDGKITDQFLYAYVVPK